MIKYHEVHITVEPVEGDRLELFENICKQHKFRSANLLMVKNRKPTDTRSNKDQFCTGRFDCFDDAIQGMAELLNKLSFEGFKIWRSKIEAVLFDARYS